MLKPLCIPCGRGGACAKKFSTAVRIYRKMQRIRPVASMLACAVALVTGCASSTPQPQTPDPTGPATSTHAAKKTTKPKQQPQRTPKDAAAIVNDLIKPRMQVYLDVTKLRDHPVGPQIMRLKVVKKFLSPIIDPTQLDPLQDANAAFISTTGINSTDTAALIVSHNKQAPVLRAAVDTMIQSSDPTGEWLGNTQVPAAIVRSDGFESLLVLGQNKLLVMLAPNMTSAVNRFEGPLKLSNIEPPYAVIATVQNPSKTLHAPGSPAIPDSLEHATIHVTLQPEGGAEVSMEATSTSEQQAEIDAVSLSKSIERATTIRVSAIRIRMFRPVVFEPNGRVITSTLQLSANELSQLVYFLSAMASR